VIEGDEGAPVAGMAQVSADGGLVFEPPDLDGSDKQVSNELGRGIQLMNIMSSRAQEYGRHLMTYSRMSTANKRVQAAVHRMRTSWDTTTNNIDTAITHIMDSTADSTDECVTKLKEARGKLKQIHEEVEFLASTVNTTEMKWKEITTEVTDKWTELGELKRWNTTEITKCATKREHDRETLTVLKQGLDEISHTMEVTKSEADKTTGPWKPLSEDVVVKPVLLATEETPATPAPAPKLKSLDEVHSMMQKSKGTEEALMKCLAKHGIAPSKDKVGKAKPHKAGLLEESQFPEETSPTHPPGVREACWEEREKFMKEYMIVTREISRVIEQYEVEVVSHRCEDAVEVTYHYEQEIIDKELKRDHKEMVEMETWSLKPRLEVQIQAEIRLKEWITRTKEECKSIDVTVTDLDKVHETIEELEKCPPGTLENMDFNITEFAGFAHFQLNPDLTDEQNDALMQKKCDQEFRKKRPLPAGAHGVRAAEVSEIIAQFIHGMPEDNTDTLTLIPACPLCDGISNDGESVSGHYRVCFEKGAPLVHEYMKRAGCNSGRRGAMCIYEKGSINKTEITTRYEEIVMNLSVPIPYASVSTCWDQSTLRCDPVETKLPLRCCNDNLTMVVAKETYDPDCTISETLYSLEDANKTCNDLGYHLCTLGELKNESITCDDTCSLNDKRVWSSTPCILKNRTMQKEYEERRIEKAYKTGVEYRNKENATYKVYRNYSWEWWTHSNQTSKECQNAIELDFKTSTVTCDNIEENPDVEDNCVGLVFANIANVSGTMVDLTVTSKDSNYRAYNETRNGKRGDFGRINVETNSTANLKFAFTYHDNPGVPFEMSSFMFSILDIDQGKNGSYEAAFVTGFDGYYVTAESLVDVDFMEDGRHRFSSTNWGTDQDNPVDKWNMTKLQKQMSVSLLFANTSEFDLTYQVAPTGYNGNSGRNFLFTGKTDFACLSRVVNQTTEHIITTTVTNCSWEASASGKWKYYLKAANSTLEMIVNGTFDHADIQLGGHGQYGMLNTDNGFELVPFGLHYIIKAGGSEKFVHLRGGAHNGSDLEILGDEMYAAGHEESQFDLVEAGDGSYIVKAADRDLYLGIDNDTEKPGVKLSGDEHYAKTSPLSHFEVVALDPDEYEGKALVCNGSLINPTITFTTPPPTCARGLRKNKLNFLQSTLISDNLGGLGPRKSDAREIRFEGITEVDGTSVDLVVTNSSEYVKAPNAMKSSSKSGDFGRINMRGGYKTKFAFNFVETGGTASVSLPDEIYLTLLDIDQDKKARQRETWSFPDILGYVVDPDAYLEVAGTDVSTSFQSLVHGQGCDNPRTDADLGVKAECNENVPIKLSALVMLPAGSGFEVDLEVTCRTSTGRVTECKSGRNFLFGGESLHSEPCEASE